MKTLDASLFFEWDENMWVVYRGQCNGLHTIIRKTTLIFGHYDDIVYETLWEGL